MHSIYNLKYSLLKKIPIAFHNGSNHDYHFVVKELAEEFETQFTCLGENTEKHATFLIPIEKEVIRIDKNREEVTKNISYILQFIDSARCMARSLSDLVNNISERINKIKCKQEHDDKKYETCGITYEICDCFLEYINSKDDSIDYKYLNY